MDDDAPTKTSRRALLGALATAPAVVAVLSPSHGALMALHDTYGDEPVRLIRSKAGRSLSRQRYLTAEEFFPDDGPRSQMGLAGFLYYAGIAAQLALSAHLLDVGFPDGWVARNIGLRVAKSLAYANATGFAHDCPDMARLAKVLTPYWVWNRPRLFGEPSPDDGGFTVEDARPLLRALLHRAGDVTGHRPIRRRGGRP